MKKLTICLVSPFPPPLGGMAIQAGKLQDCLEKEGFRIIAVRTNVIFSHRMKWVGRIPFVRTIFNTVFFLINLVKAVRHCDGVYFLTGFFDFFFWITFPAIILLKLLEKKVILNARGGGAEAFFMRWKYIVGPVIRLTDLIATPSAFLQNVFKAQLGICPVVVPNIADFSQFKFKKRLSFGPRLIVTRSLEEIYNIECVIRAFKIIHDNYPHSKLSIVGEGSLRKELEKFKQSNGLNDSVIFHGRVSHDKIQAMYDDNDIFINASNVDNLPGTILEAFASGLPVVSTNAGGIPYMVEHEKTGLLVDKNDFIGLADQVLRLLKNKELPVLLTHNAHAECQNYSWESVKNKILPILNSNF